MRLHVPASDSLSPQRTVGADDAPSTSDDEKPPPTTATPSGATPPAPSASRSRVRRRRSSWLRDELSPHTPDASQSSDNMDNVDNMEAATTTDDSGAETDESSGLDSAEAGALSGDGVVERRRLLADKAKSKSEDTRVARLREAVLISQQRARVSTARLPALDPRGTSAALRRVSPIKEEPSAVTSPTLDGSFASPMTICTSSASTDSARTIRGTAPPTPAAIGMGTDLPTPSCPFPHVPGTPRTWASTSHQPFTALSPTIPATNNKHTHSPRDRPMSDPTTPAASIATFMPAGSARSDMPSEDAQFPTPSLYDVVLALNSEPGMDAWWAAVVNILRDWYGAERAILAVPADSTELENVPWGQEASYNVAGDQSVAYKEEKKPSDSPLRKLEDPDRPKPWKATNLPTHLPTRPKFTSRHSYAGVEQNMKDVTSPFEAPAPSARPARPMGPLRTVSHAPQTLSRPERRAWEPLSPRTENPPYTPHPHSPHPLRKLLSQDCSSIGTADFSSVPGQAIIGPHVAVFTSLRALDSETDCLLDSAGVIRVLELGKVVTLTRDYTASVSSRSASTEPTYSETDKSKKHDKGKQKSSSGDRKLGAGWSASGNKAMPDYFGRAKTKTSYEEYEQLPLSPWARSPAPSPAIQANPEENPFFSAMAIDESFNPTESCPNYAQFGQVEAIGVDKASTITHIPLIHPHLSPIMPVPDRRGDECGNGKKGAAMQQSSAFTSDATIPSMSERRAPIAVISFLSPTVPYPQSLTQSLKLLAPHLATSFGNANSFSNVYKQAASICYRRNMSNQRVGFAPLPNAPESLEDLLRLDIDEINDMNSSVTGSITSPSDRSVQSHLSPGSVVGTPTWDPGNIGFSRHSVTNTPAHLAGGENIDSYFDAKKRLSATRLDSSANLTPMPRVRQRSRSPAAPEARTASDSKRGVLSSTKEPSEGTTTPTSAQAENARDQGTSPTSQSQKSRGSSGDGRHGEFSSPRKTSIKTSLSQPDRKPHTQLHSFGADFKASFTTLPTATMPAERRISHIRSSSLENQPDMLPPSEKLLRIIIDSLPVQVFMASPSDGAVTWVNSKYLVYRGQDSHQILQEPWRTIHDDDLDEHMKLWKRSLRTGQQFSHKVRLQRFDGQYRWFYVRAAPLRDRKQNIVHWIGTNMDFHDQYVAQMHAARQQETAASEFKYRALANSSPQIVFAVTRSMGITFCNSQWVMYSGQSEELARGMGFMDHVHPDELDRCRLPSFDEDGTPTEVPVTVPHAAARRTSARESLLSSTTSSSDDQTVTSPDHECEPDADGELDTRKLPQVKLSQLASTGILKVTRDAEGRPSYSTEVRLRSKDGEYRWHLVRVLQSELQSDANDETWYGTCTDINDHKLLEKTLKEAMDAKSRFLSNMSHEIRTPLNGITGMVNFLIDTNLTPEQLEHVSIIKSSTEGLRDLIDDILDLSKVEAGMITLNMDWMHVRSLIEEVNDITSALAIEKGLELNYIVEENVPRMVKGDRYRIRQILLNVIGNAIKFTQHGEVFVRCERRESETAPTEPSKGLVVFEVIDTGSGFSEKEAQFLFKRFSQIDGSSTRQHGGTGLGLAISMQLTELHGGKMKASSVPGKGSTFTFGIMVGLPSLEDQPPLPPTPIPGMTMPAPTVAWTPLIKSDSTSSILMPSPTLNTLFRQQIAQHAKELSDSPGVYSYSPGTERHTSVSSGSEPSVSSSITSSHSDHSSGSSYMSQRMPVMANADPMLLRLPTTRSTSAASSGQKSDDTDETERPGLASSPSFQRLAASPLHSTAPIIMPPLLSILVVCPLQWSREATVRHIEQTLPKSTANNITARESVEECIEMLSGADPVIFTHVVLYLPEPTQIITFMNLLFTTEAPRESSTLSLAKVSPPAAQLTTSLVIITNLSKKREIMTLAPHFDYEKLQCDRSLRFVYKPLKPSKFAVVFDPQKEREMSTDKALEGAQAVAVSQKQVFEEMKRRLSGKGFKVLLVEDNRTNQMVLLKFLGKASISVEAVPDGVQCTEKVFSQPHDAYSIILCDLHMPNKDGYQTCKEIRKWERKNKFPHLPIIALSANVLGDVHEKCVEAGFNSYVTKPVDFKDLSQVMIRFLEPPEALRGKGPAFMTMRDKE